MKKLLLIVLSILTINSLRIPSFALADFPAEITPPPARSVPGAWASLIPGKSADWCYKNGVATIQGLECLFVNIVRVLIPLVGIAFFIMLVSGAFQFITAGGEAKALQKARAAITAAIFGLIAFFGIWFILLLIRTITGVDVTNFAIPAP